MNARKILIRLGAGIVSLAAALAMTAPAATQAATTIVIDNISPADGCGKYDDDTAETDPVAAIYNAPTNSTVVICPGTYTLSGTITIDNKKLTIKRALTDPGQTPTLEVDTSSYGAFYISNSTSVTIDGLVIDGRPSTQAGYIGIDLHQSGLTLKNSAILGPDLATTNGITVDNTGLTRALSVTLSTCLISGYSANGVSALGAVKLTVKSCLLDPTDGGRMSPAFPNGIYFNGATADTVVPTGSVSSSRILNHFIGVYIKEASKVSVTSNTFDNNHAGVRIDVTGSHHNADSNKISSNTILRVPSDGVGIFISDVAADTFSIKKLTISKNMILASQYIPHGVVPFGIYISANVPAETTITGTISSNTFWGFPATPSPLSVVNENDYAGVTVSKNTITP